jgi:hypothetical protein
MMILDWKTNFVILHPGLEMEADAACFLLMSSLLTASFY